MLWPGLGMNYKSIDSTNISNDKAYFKSLGIKYIRPHIPAYDAADLATWRSVAASFAQDGYFWVQWGISKSATLTSSNKAAFYAAIETEAAWAQANGIQEFGLGNEEELHCDNSTLTYAQLRNDLRAEATTCQSIFTNGPISYQTESGTLASGHGSKKWEAEGKGDIDLISINTYGLWTISTQIFNVSNYTTYLPSFISTFGASNCYISEFNLDANDTNFQNIPEERASIEIASMQAYIQSLGYTRAQLYQWRSYKDQSDVDFCIKYRANGDYKLMWNPLSNNNKRRWFINV